jgi:membrane protein
VIERFLPPEVHDSIAETIVALNENSVGAGIVGFGGSTVLGVLVKFQKPYWAGLKG